MKYVMQVTEQVRRHALAGLVILTVTGCASEPIASATAPPDLAGPCLPAGKWLATGSGKVMDTASMMDRLNGNSVVLLGEFHDEVDHHRWQAQTIAALYGRNPDLVIGLEMLPRSAQPVLDKWVAGDLSLDQFLVQSNWMDYWQFDSELYRPVLELARLQRIPLVALNVDKALVQRVSEQGWDAIPEAEREGVTSPAAPSDEYLEMLIETFRMHGAHGHGGGEGDDLLEDPQFQRFVQNQQLWDRAMAQRIAEAVRRSGSTQMVALMGSGHAMSGFGVPHQLKDLGVEDAAVLMPWDPRMECEMLTSQVADGFFGMAYQVPEPDGRPKLGVHIENVDSGVRVIKVVPESVAARLGIREGDVITQAAERPVQGVSDVVHIVQSMQPGTWLPLTVARGEERLQLVAKFSPPPLPTQ